MNIEAMFVRGLLKYAEEYGCARSNVASKLPLLKEFKKDKIIPSDMEFERFLSEAAKTLTGRQLVIWVLVSAFSGTRPAEAFHLEWSDIDLVQDRIFIRPKTHHKTKTGKFRVVEIHPSVKSALINWKADWEATFPDAGKPHDWVFFHPKQPRKRAGGFRKSFTRAAREAGIPHMTPYTLRHFFISKAVMSGVDLLTISRWVGHSGTQMIERVYGHLSDTHRKQQMAKIQIGSGAARKSDGKILDLEMEQK